MASFGKAVRSEMIFNLNSFIFATIITNTNFFLVTLAECQQHRNLRNHLVLSCHLLALTMIIIHHGHDNDLLLFSDDHRTW